VRAPGCNGLQRRENDTLLTPVAASSCTGLHRDHDRDHGSDHETTVSGPSLASVAEAVLSAIASGSTSSLELTAKLVEALLAEPVLREAMELDGLLRTRSPFALVRAVALAETLLPGGRAARRTDRCAR
jgi:hypothetical protein